MIRLGSVTWRLVIGFLALACLVGASWPLFGLDSALENFVQVAVTKPGTGSQGVIPDGIGPYGVSYFVGIFALAIIAGFTSVRLITAKAGIEAKLLALFLAIICLSEVVFFQSQFRVDWHRIFLTQVALHLLAATAFYHFSARCLELWRPGGLSGGLPAGTAVRQATPSHTKIWAISAVRQATPSHTKMWAISATLGSVLVLLGQWDVGDWELLPGFAALIMMLILIWLGIRHLRSAYGVAPEPRRRRIAWLVHGIVLAFWAVILLHVLPEFWKGWSAAHTSDPGAGTGAGATLLTIARNDLGTFIPVSLIVVSVAVGVFHSGAIDPELVLKRTTIYGALAVMFLFLFAGIESLVSELVERGLGLPGLVGSMLVGGFVAVMIAPLRKPLSRLADRLVPRTERSGQGVDQTAN